MLTTIATPHKPWHAHTCAAPRKWAAGAFGLAAGAYAGYVGVTWLRYGHPARESANDADPLLDRFMPVYDIVERHHIHVAAPPEITLATAGEHRWASLAPLKREAEHRCRNNQVKAS